MIIIYVSHSPYKFLNITCCVIFILLVVLYL